MKQLSKEQQGLFDRLFAVIETSLSYHNALNEYYPENQLTWEELIEKLNNSKTLKDEKTP